MSEEIFRALAAPFPPERVSWRVGSVTKDGKKAMALAYIDARDVMERLDAVVGPGRWQRRHPHVNGTTTCEIDLWLADMGGWVTKTDGAGDTAVEAEKGSLSDSFKRAAVNWGVGRYLYDLPSPWVEIDQFKKIVPEELKRLETLLRRQTGDERPAAQTSQASRLTAFEATRQGIGEAIKTFIDGATAKELDLWEKNFDRNTAHVPLGWLASIRERIELRKEELANPKVVEAEAGAAELTEAFRGTVGIGGGRSAPLAGNNGHVAQ